MQLHQIREARAAKVSEARSLLASTPQLNAEGQAAFDRIKKEITELEGQEARAQFIEDAERRSLGAPVVDKARNELEERERTPVQQKPGLRGSAEPLSGAFMKAGQLDQRVTVERLQGGFDELGQPIESWAPLFTCWASVEPLTGREFIAAQAAQSEVTARIRMRFRPWVTAQDRVIHEGKAYNIASVIDHRSQGRELVLMCKAIG